MNPQLRNPSSGTIVSADAVRKAIVEFQAFAGLNITGNHCSVFSIMQELKY
jgi:hypothetical protein